MRTAAVVLALLASLVGCTSDGGPTSSSPSRPSASRTGPTASPATPTPTPTISPSPAKPAITVMPSQFEGGFSTPTGNFHCYLSRGFARCNAKAQPWTPLPKSGECNTGWTTTIELGLTKPARLRGDCYDPVLYGDGPPLPYGHALQVDSMRCVSRQSELQCLVVGTKRGFVVNRSSYRLTAATSGLATAPTPSAEDRPITIGPAGFHAGFVARIGFGSGEGGAVCDLDDRGVSCIVSGTTGWQPPQRPTPCGDSDGDTTTTVEISGGVGRAFQDCRFDSNSGGPDLEAGRGIRIGRLECLSRQADLKCTDQRTGHGFVVSKAQFQAF